MDLIAFLSCVMIASGVATFVRLLFITAPYGRYSRTGWGPMINAKTAWLVQEIWSFAVPAFMLANSDADQLRRTLSPSKATLLGMFLCHYGYRSLIYPVRIRGGQPTPAIICAMAAGFCTINGFLQGWWLMRQPARVTDCGWTFWVGVSLWSAGWAVNLHSDNTLRNLREKKTKGYSIPTGGMFDYISGANYFGETVEWAGWALAAGNLPAAAFAIFTFCNLAPRAWSHHHWYKAHFGTAYPEGRRAFVPFVL